jgi:hypothetical protein
MITPQTNNSSFKARSFNVIEIAKIKELKAFMKHATDVATWNDLREQAKSIWDEKTISAVDGMKKFVNDKQNNLITIKL